MLPDTRIIHRHGTYAVLAETHVVTWPDRSQVILHPVQAAGCDAPALAAMLTRDGRCLIVDLRKLCRQLRADLALAPPRDVRGLIYYSLRAAFADARAMTAEAARRCEAYSPVVMADEPDLALAAA